MARQFGRADAALDERAHVGEARDVTLLVVPDVLDDTAPWAGRAVSRGFAPQLDQELLFRPCVDGRHAPECTPPAVRTASEWCA